MYYSLFYSSQNSINQHFMKIFKREESKDLDHLNMISTDEEIFDKVFEKQNHENQTYYSINDEDEDCLVVDFLCTDLQHFSEHHINILKSHIFSYYEVTINLHSEDYKLDFDDVDNLDQISDNTDNTNQNIVVSPALKI